MRKIQATKFNELDFWESFNTKIVLFSGGREIFSHVFAESYTSCEPERVMFVTRNFGKIV